jgi:hypothetical protein
MIMLHCMAQGLTDARKAPNKLTLAWQREITLGGHDLIK